MANIPLTFVHLSDIHLGTPGMKGVCDANAPLRGALEQDLAELRERLGTITGILVTGDITFSGLQDQYLQAGAWLAKLCSIGGCTEDHVWMVPGNHDVLRSVHTGSMAVRDFHEKIRALKPHQFEGKLTEMLTDATAGKGFFDEPLANYNAFASRYRCAVSSKQPYWEKDLTLNDGSALRLRGATSTLISNFSDDDKANKLVLGVMQLNMHREPGIEYLLLCHHPPEWLLDRDAVNQKLNALVRIQLFGHKHAQDTHQVDQNLRLTSGALHPEREGQEWTPMYNVLSMSIDGGGDNRVLKVDVHARVWNATQQKFVAEAGSDPVTGAVQFKLTLPPWSPRPVASVAPVTPAKPSAAAAPAPSAPAQDDLFRRLTFRFMTLSPLNRLNVLDQLGLETGELATIDSAFYSRALTLVNASSRLAECWDAINDVSGSTEPNPFQEVAGRSVNA